MSPKLDPNGQLIGEYRDNASTATPVDDWLVRQETVWLGDILVGVITKPIALARSRFSYSRFYLYGVGYYAFIGPGHGLPGINTAIGFTSFFFVIGVYKRSNK
ncbi:hypothetical protein [Nitrosomonas sp. wSCUT-2]